MRVVPHLVGVRLIRGALVRLRPDILVVLCSKYRQRFVDRDQYVGVMLIIHVLGHHRQHDGLGPMSSVVRTAGSLLGSVADAVSARP